jgi:hypothetical protein
MELMREMKQHILKTEPEPFAAVRAGRKTAEFRIDDRGFEVDDELILVWSVDVGHVETLRLTVTHIVRGPAFGIPEGYAMLSFRKERSE